MRRLLPNPAKDVDPLVDYLDAPRPAHEGRPWLAAGMIASIDGATEISGTSGALGGPADKQVFRAVRACADVILVAAGTVRAERYKPAWLPGPVRVARRARNRVDLPVLAIVTSSLELDLESDLFTHDTARPIVITTEDADVDRVDAVAAVAPVLQYGEGLVDLPAALGRLHQDGHRVVVSEGGPTLNGALAATVGFDEIFLTTAPVVAAGGSHRIVHGGQPTLDQYELASLLIDEDMLFSRYLRRTTDS